MTGRLVFALCEHYLPEARAALAAEKLDNALAVGFSARCGRPALTPEELAAVIKPLGDVEHVEVFGACCMACGTDFTSTEDGIHIHRLEHCFNLIADTDLINRCLEKGAYLTTPGWLANWPANMEWLGLNQETARKMFAETTTAIVMLDTGIDKQSAGHLRDFAGYVGRPFEIIYTGISLLRLLFARTVLTWNMEAERKKSLAEIHDLQKKSSMHAMAIDLLSNLARIVDEAQAIAAMLDVFIMLFAPRRLCYLSYQEGLPDKLWIRPDMVLDDSEKDSIKNTLAGFDQESGYTESGRGFLLRIFRRFEVRGVIAVEDIAFPEYLDQYLNLALGIVNICELPIENARKYEKLVHIEEMLRKANDELYQLSTTDALTGIANRRAFDEYVEIEWKRMLRNNTPLSLIFCDIDFFKNFNDHYGHKAGDICLHTVAQIIRKMALRPGDFVARFGGEEFIVILPNTSAEGAMYIAEKIRLAVAHYGIIHEYSETAPYVTLSLGVAQIQPPFAAGLVASSLFLKADAALYEAKKKGRNCTVVRNNEVEKG